MRIACFGNTNNYPFLLARGLRELGHNALLIVNQKQALHRPENLDPSLDGNYPGWIHDYSDVSNDHFIGPTPMIIPVLRLLENSDAVILNHVGPSLLAYFDRPAIAFLTGSDLDYLARFETVSTLGRKWDDKFRASNAARLFRELWTGFVSRQRNGILRCRAVNFFPQGMLPDCDRLLDDIGVASEQRFHMYMADTSLAPAPFNDKRKRVRIFCGARLTWKRPVEPGACELDYKGTDVLLRGLAAFLDKSDDGVELRLVEKGWHVAETHALVEELGLSPHVTWLSEMPRKGFDAELREADVCIDQLNLGAIGMAAVDAMLIGKPLIANGHPDVWYPTLAEPPPICHASTADEVCAQLMRLVPDSKERKRVGQQSRKYALREWAPESKAAFCVDILS